MRDKRGGAWWSTVVTGAALVVVTGVARARGDEEGRNEAYQAGEIVGSVLGPVLLVGLVAFLIVRFGKVNGLWALPAVLAAAATLNLVVVLARAGEEAAGRTACEGAQLLQAETLVPGAPYQARPLNAAAAARIVGRFSPEDVQIDATQVVDSRDRAAFLLIAATSRTELVRAVDVFAGFARRAGGSLEETEMDGRPARAARRQGGTTIIATTGDCYVVTLVGAEDGPTRELATDLRLDPA